MPNKQISRHNPEGYADPTAQAALQPIQRMQDESDMRLAEWIKVLKKTIDLAGYELLNRIELKDRKTGRTYR